MNFRMSEMKKIFLTHANLKKFTAKFNAVTSSDIFRGGPGFENSYLYEKQKIKLSITINDENVLISLLFVAPTCDKTCTTGTGVMCVPIIERQECVINSYLVQEPQEHKQCYSSFQALIQYPDVVTAQAAKLVSYFAPFHFFSASFSLFTAGCCQGLTSWSLTFTFSAPRFPNFQ
ncbi:hypothetical protein RUM43_006790 [Polyplax serrata]|uniref:Uncharacterized protein n=1 Tax=Polyplax serrata TaxID=468196 RepID=A0AAN8S0S5_POLSC